MDSMDDPSPSPFASLTSPLNKYATLYRTQLDRTTPHTTKRWSFTLFSLFVFLIRIFTSQAYFILCYGLGIYLLNLFLAFLQPKFDPSLAKDLADDEVEEGMELPTSRGGGTMGSMGPMGGDGNDGEFRPFIRRLPEFKFWYSATKAIILTTIATLFPFLDIPVYWPILLVYFCVLFTVTMRRQIKHMMKHKYVPFDFGRKTTYN